MTLDSFDGTVPLFVGGVETPFGGYEESGIGREKGAQAVEEYTQLKTITSRSFRRD